MRSSGSRLTPPDDVARAPVTPSAASWAARWSAATSASASATDSKRMSSMHSARSGTVFLLVPPLMRPTFTVMPRG